MDRQEPSEALKIKISHLKEKIEKPKDEMRRLVGLQAVIVRCAKIATPRTGSASCKRRGFHLERSRSCQ